MRWIEMLSVFGYTDNMYEDTETSWWRIVKIASQSCAILVFFVFFAAIVKPEIGSRVIPLIVDFSATYAQEQQGIDLDPMYVSESMSSRTRVTGLYSTRYGPVGDGIYGDLITSHTRVVAMNRFLSDYDSPMARYAETIVAAADNVGLDWRLVVSISGVESAFGRLIPYNSYNGWGWRGGPGGAYSQFDSWEDSIVFVTTRIAEGYGTSIDVFTMEPTYCPPCGQNPQHAWANGVTRYMGQLTEYRSNL